MTSVKVITVEARISEGGEYLPVVRIHRNLKNNKIDLGKNFWLQLEAKLLMEKERHYQKALF